ncbi:hypothetical protein FRC06_011829 [Ceratobasidium sp. 370]|nr:hypothetical protein FRC06_011829 [Ceratobasidium sp. 370]
MEEDKLLDLLTSVKNMVKSDPAVARTTLTAHPNLAYALMKEMVTLDVVDPDVLARTLQAATGVQPTLASAPPVQTYLPPQTSYPPPTTPSYPPAQSAPAPSIPPFMYQQSRQQQQNVPTPAPAPAPAPAQPTYQSRGPPPPPQMQTQTPTPIGLAPEQQAMIQRLAMLTPDQIAALPPADRAALLELRRQLGLT